ncbi:uncharacterized protein M421DRAFT_94142 [Didymella exigua CBS 183.55]|uniref:AB hydrolase-1 domain-containing protein n=1 Tax=Didymella exigua CBS 183.55 TaxID=1150837 RepID=A0A6A5RFQ3_9PLEO|nr:uncharacterized protein M421DRAFT_94142 [Didymella exigua CBS 183.55]KAF1926299.1 hypothetical protein M421DRAFT_94142 [Didymella exigua CBS 183.55]
MANSRSVVLLISGGWHTPQSYAKLTEALSASGFVVHIPALGSISDERPPSSDLEADSALIRPYAQGLAEAGKEMLVLIHSYGGQVGTNALAGLGASERSQKGLPGGVSHLIYMTETALPESKSMVDPVRDFGHEELLPWLSTSRMTSHVSTVTRSCCRLVLMKVSPKKRRLLMWLHWDGRTVPACISHLQPRVRRGAMGQ